MKMVPVLTSPATLLFMAASTTIAVFLCFHQSTAHLPSCCDCAIVVGFVLGLLVCTQLGWALYHDRSIDAIDQEVLQKCSSGRQRKPEKRTLRQNKSGSRGHRGITEQPKGPGLSKPSGLWGIWHIWAVVLSLAACCNGDFQVAKATVSWLMGIYDPFEDINVIAATAAEHESLGLSNESSNVTNGTWGVRHLCVYCCFTFAALMASVKAVMAALSWLAGCRDFFVDDVTEESSSRSSSKPNTKTRRRNKNGRKGHSGIREVSKGLGVSNPGGLWGIRHIWVFCLFFTAYCNAMFQAIFYNAAHSLVT